MISLRPAFLLLTAGLGGLPQVGFALHPSDEVIRHQLDDILTRPEFKSREDFWLRVLRAIGSFVLWLAELHVRNPALYWVLIAACVVVLVLLVVHLIRTLRRVFGFGSRLAPAEHPEEKRRRLSRAYWEEARSWAAQGEFTEAIRFLFLSLVYRYDESGKVSFRTAYTNREYLGLFADRLSIQSGLKVFVDTLDDHWYGQHPTDRERFESCLVLFERLK
jgi:hypothetical protein